VVQQLSEEQRRERWARLTAHAWEDAAFKQQLLSNPKPILNEAGLAVPENFRVRIVEEGTSEAADVGNYTLTEESPNSFSLVMSIPPKPSDIQSGELSEAELESVAGGVGNICCCCTCCPCCSCT
jgi:hypothetical protein